MKKADPNCQVVGGISAGLDAGLTREFVTKGGLHSVDVFDLHINGPDAGGVLFEYGGAPRKMYPGAAALTQILGVPEAFVRKIERGGLRAYLFRAQNRVVAVAWNRGAEAKPLRLSARTRAFDIMGNEVPARDTVVGESPLYVTGDRAEEVSAVFGDGEN